MRKALNKSLIWIESMHITVQYSCCWISDPCGGVWSGAEEQQLYEFLDFLWSGGRARVTFSIGHSTLSLRSREIGTFHKGWLAIAKLKPLSLFISPF